MAPVSKVPGSPIRRFDPAAFRWEGVKERAYKDQPPAAPGSGMEPDRRAFGWQGVVRNTLFGRAGEQAGFELRYFEIDRGGFSSLEKHEHVHAVVVMRGEADVLVGADVYRVKPFDFIYVEPLAAHRFVNVGTEPFGFLCIVDRQRDKPASLTAEEIQCLAAEPGTSHMVHQDREQS